MGILKYVSDVLSKRPLLVGLDIGASSIKIARLKQTSEGVKLLAFDMAVLPPESILDGAVMNPKAVTEKIRELAKWNGCEGAKCAIAVSGHSTIVKKLSIPEMTEVELAESINWEAEQYIPFDIKDVNVDMQILNPKAGQGQMDVLLAAAKKDVVNDYMDVVREAGLLPIVVDTDTFACQNAFMLNYGFPPDEIVALINVGASTININIVSNGITSFTRDISMGGALVTEEIMKDLNVSWEEAEHYKTMNEESKDEESKFSSAVFREVQKVHERVSEMLITEIQHSLDFFVATTIKSDIARIYLSGGASQQSAFIRAMEQRFEIPVELVNPFRNIVVDLRKFNLALLMERMSPIATVVIGLARRFRGDSAGGAGDVRINLIDEKRKIPLFTRRKFFYFPRPPWTISVRMPFSKKRCILTLFVD